MYYLGFISLISAVVCQSTTSLVPVKKGYFNISPSTVQVTLTVQNGGLSDSINLSDPENIFGDYIFEESDGSQHSLKLLSTSDFQSQPFNAMVSDIASNVCLMSLSSNEESASDAVDHDSVVKKVGALTGLIVADMASVSEKNPQTILNLYNAAKSGTSFNTAQLSLPASGSGLNSRVTIQVKLGGYPFMLGVPLHTNSNTKKSQCDDISNLATIYTLNHINYLTNSAGQLLSQSDQGSTLQTYNNGGPSDPTVSESPSFPKEMSNGVSNLVSSDIEREVPSASSTEEKVGTQSPQSYSTSSSETFTEQLSSVSDPKTLSNDKTMEQLSSNAAGLTTNYNNNIQPILRESSKDSAQPSNNEKTSPISLKNVQSEPNSTEAITNADIDVETSKAITVAKSNTASSVGTNSNINPYTITNIGTGIGTDGGAGTEAIGKPDHASSIGTVSNMQVSTNTNTGTGTSASTGVMLNTNPGTNIKMSSLNRPMLPFIPNLGRNSALSNNKLRGTMPSNFGPNTFQLNPARAYNNPINNMIPNLQRGNTMGI